MCSTLNCKYTNLIFKEATQYRLEPGYLDFESSHQEMSLLTVVLAKTQIKGKMYASDQILLHTGVILPRTCMTKPTFSVRIEVRLSPMCHCRCET